MSVVEIREQHAPVNADVGIKTASEGGRATTSVPGPGARADGMFPHAQLVSLLHQHRILSGQVPLRNLRCGSSAGSAKNGTRWRGRSSEMEAEARQVGEEDHDLPSVTHLSHAYQQW